MGEYLLKNYGIDPADLDASARLVGDRLIAQELVRTRAYVHLLEHFLEHEHEVDGDWGADRLLLDEARRRFGLGIPESLCDDCGRYWSVQMPDDVTRVTHVRMAIGIGNERTREDVVAVVLRYLAPAVKQAIGWIVNMNVEPRVVRQAIEGWKSWPGHAQLLNLLRPDDPVNR